MIRFHTPPEIDSVVIPIPVSIIQHHPRSKEHRAASDTRYHPPHLCHTMSYHPHPASLPGLRSLRSPPRRRVVGLSSLRSVVQPHLASRVSMEMDQAWMRRTQTRSEWKSRRARDLFVVLTMHVPVPRPLRRFRVAAFQTRVFADAAKTQTFALIRGRDVFSPDDDQEARDATR